MTKVSRNVLFDGVIDVGVVVIGQNTKHERRQDIALRTVCLPSFDYLLHIMSANNITEGAEEHTCSIFPLGLQNWIKGALS